MLFPRCTLAQYLPVVVRVRHIRVLICVAPSVSARVTVAYSTALLTPLSPASTAIASTAVVVSTGSASSSCIPILTAETSQFVSRFTFFFILVFSYIVAVRWFFCGSYQKQLRKHYAE